MVITDDTHNPLNATRCGSSSSRRHSSYSSAWLLLLLPIIGTQRRTLAAVPWSGCLYAQFPRNYLTTRSQLPDTAVYIVLQEVPLKAVVDAEIMRNLVDAHRHVASSNNALLRCGRSEARGEKKYCAAPQRNITCLTPKMNGSPAFEQIVTWFQPCLSIRSLVTSSNVTHWAGPCRYHLTLADLSGFSTIPLLQEALYAVRPSELPHRCHTLLFGFSVIHSPSLWLHRWNLHWNLHLDNIALSEFTLCFTIVYFYV